MKLLKSGLSEKKAVIAFAYEHTPPQVDLSIVLKAFEVLAKDVLGIELGERQTAEFSGLIHPFHQQGSVIGWEVLGRKSGRA